MHLRTLLQVRLGPLGLVRCPVRLQSVSFRLPQLSLVLFELLFRPGAQARQQILVLCTLVPNRRLVVAVNLLVYPV